MTDPWYPIVVIGGVPVVTAPQEIDADNAEPFGKMLLHAAADGTVVVDMTWTRFFDSAALHVLAGAHERAVSAGGQLLLAIDADAVMLRVLALTGIDQLIPICADLHEALQAARAVAPQPLQRPAGSFADGDSPDG